MMGSEGPGWHREPRRHHDAALKVRRRPRAQRKADWIRKGGSPHPGRYSREYSPVQLRGKLLEVHKMMNEEAAEWRKSSEGALDSDTRQDWLDYYNGLNDANNELYWTVDLLRYTGATPERIKAQVAKEYSWASDDYRNKRTKENEGRLEVWNQANEKVNI